MSVVAIVFLILNIDRCQNVITESAKINVSQGFRNNNNIIIINPPLIAQHVGP